VRIARSLKDFVSGDFLPAARCLFFATLVLFSMVLNGDAHLKNFAVLYPSPQGPVTMAPVFDVVTTTVYLRHDVPALSLAGTKKWWPRMMLKRFAISHLSLSVGDINEVVARLADAVMATRQTIPMYIAEHPELRETGDAMMAAWEEGVIGLGPAASR
jgi:serine/threonine-protein kinase HipA